MIMASFLIALMLFSQTGKTALLPEDVIMTQSIEDDCTGDGEKEIIVVYDIGTRFGTETYRGTCVAIFQRIAGSYLEVYKTRLSADTKIKLIKIFDEPPPFIEVQWFTAAGGGNTYICYDPELKRFREVLNFESGGINRKDINGDGSEEVFAFTFERADCPDKSETYASFLTFYRWKKNCFEAFPENPHMMRPGTTYFASPQGIAHPNLLAISRPRYPSREFTGPEDCSFTLFAVKRPPFLSLTITVRDDVIQQYSGSQGIIHGDHIMLVIDTDIAGDFCGHSVNSDDIALALSPGNFEDIAPEIANLNPLSPLSDSVANHADILFEKVVDGYKIRMDIPVDEPFLERGTAGLGIILYDRDKQKGNYPEFKLAWPSTMDKKDPTTWGNLFLFAE
jgi:hypothetical protein